MKIIYEPAGKAREYSPLAANLYTGCSHGCKYCYAPSAKQQKREVFHSRVEPRKDVIKWLSRDAPEFRGREVLLCFTCDPYQPEEVDHGTTRQAIEVMHSAGAGVNILTKGGMRAMRDRDLFAHHPGLTRLGATLTFSNAEDSQAWEPQAADPDDRLRMLREAHAMGIRTWASLEPVIDPEQTLELIRLSADFVDEFKVGRWNHDARASQIDWRGFASQVVGLLDGLGKRYMIKKDLAAYLTGVTK